MKYIPERDHVPSLFLAVMVPGDRVHFQHLRHFDETTEMHALAERHGQPFVDHGTLAHGPRRVGHVLQEPARTEKQYPSSNRNVTKNEITIVRLPGLVWFTGLLVLVPSAVRVVDAPQTAVVPVSAHGQVDLPDALVGRHVQSLVLRSIKKKIINK